MDSPDHKAHFAKKCDENALSRDGHKGGMALGGGEPQEWQPQPWKKAESRGVLTRTLS